MHYTTGFRQDTEIAKVDNALAMAGYMKNAYNGLNLMQVFAANSLL